MKRWCPGVVLSFATLIAAPRAWGAEEQWHVLIVGQNAPPPAVSGEELAELRFADDDAFAVYELFRELSGNTTLLALADAPTRQRFPASADAGQVPTTDALAAAVARLRTAVQADTAAGRTPIFIFYYSGHSARDADGHLALTLADGLLSQTDLYKKVLDRIPAKVAHVIIDACRAETMVQPRDAQARKVALTPSEASAYLSQSTLNRYPHVGVVVASNRDTDAQEWDLLSRGVFTHEVISGLRGAADINGDQRIEYSELGAFLAAANREVKDPRARLQAIVRAPSQAPHAPLADLSAARTAGRLMDIGSSARRFFVEDERGNRVVEGHPEPGFSMSLVLPSRRPLFVQRGSEEAELTLASGESADFRKLLFRSRPSRARGAVESALRAGLFVAPFGPAYYRGYVDQTDTVVSVDMASSLWTTAELHATTRERSSLKPSLLVAASAALLASSVVFGALAWDAKRDYEATSWQVPSMAASDRYKENTALSAALLLSGVAFGVTALFLGTPQ